MDADLRSEPEDFDGNTGNMSHRKRAPAMRGCPPVSFFMLAGILPCALVLALATATIAFEDSYDCQAVAETNVGWDSRAKKFTAGASTTLQRATIVKLSNLKGPNPMLTGQSVTAIHKVSEADGTVWFVEGTQGGTVVGWTLIHNPGPLSPPHATLVSTKTYDLFGPATFTALYACVPNRPGG